MSFPTLFQTKPNYLQTNVWKRGSNQFIKKTKQTKQMKTKTKTKKKTLQEQHNCAWNNKNEAFGRNLKFLLMKKGDALGIPKLWRLYFLDISWGDTRGIPKLEL